MAANKQTASGSVGWAPYLFCAPVMLYLLVFQAYPLLQELYLSFTQTSLLSPAQHNWVGLRNFAELFAQEEFLQVLGVTLVYTVACVVFAIGIGLGTALLLNMPFRGRGLARSLITIPWAAPPVAVALIFIWMFNGQYGVLQYAFKLVGLSSGMEGWLDNPSRALAAVLLTTVWQIFPFTSVVILSSLQGVSNDLREAAVIDGADRFSIFGAVVWPAIRPTVMLLTLFITIWSLRRFDLIWLMTQGGPIGKTNTLVIELYRRGFTYRELGEAAAVGMVGLSLALVITVVYFRLTVRAERAAGH